MISVILLVDDDEDDVFAFHRAAKKAGIEQPIHVAINGREALDYLAGTGKFGDRNAYPSPSIVFLDLKLPYLSGLEVLAWLREQSSLRDLPVVVLSGSDERRDHDRAEELRAHAYEVKPITIDSLKKHLGGLGLLI